MIGSLRGKILERRTTGELIVEVNGVGYRVLVPISAIPELIVGSQAFLVTHTHVREDAIALFGFLTEDDFQTFEALIGAQGVGPKLALAILSVHAPNALRRIVSDGDVASLTLVPGVGKRTGEKLLLELKTRLAVPDLDLTTGAKVTNPARSDARDALGALGYNPDEIRDALTDAPQDAPAEVLIRLALKSLATNHA